MEKKKKMYVFSGIGLAVAAGILLYWFFPGGGIGTDRVAPEKGPAFPDAVTARAEVQTVTEWYDAVGTVVPKTQAQIEPQVAAQVTEVLVQAGDPVKKGELLVRLENDRLTAKLSQAQQSLQTAIAQREQARQAVNAAKAAFAQAKSAYERVKKFYDAQAATEQEFEQARSQFLQARAAVQRAEEGLSGAAAGIRLAEEMVQEAKISLKYTEIAAPADGEVLKRLVDPGDMAMPGKPVLLLRTAAGLQLEASVRESLITRVQPGDTRNVQLTTLDKTVEAVVEEVIPYADPQTRTFLVKADLPDVAGAYPGMYGKLMIPYTEVRVILIPRQAVRQVGQLQLVYVHQENGWQRRYVKTGNRYGDRVEILSGLDGGETVLVKEHGGHGE